MSCGGCEHDYTYYYGKYKIWYCKVCGDWSCKQPKPEQKIKTWQQSIDIYFQTPPGGVQLLNSEYEVSDNNDKTNTNINVGIAGILGDLEKVNLPITTTIGDLWVIAYYKVPMSSRFICEGVHL